jgi:hypothetical protein
LVSGDFMGATLGDTTGDFVGLLLGAITGVFGAQVVPIFGFDTIPKSAGIVSSDPTKPSSQYFALGIVF